MTWKSFFGVVLIAANLSSCSLVSKEECQIADWKERGYEDALAGKSMPMMLREYKATCDGKSKHPDEEAYTEGFRLGKKS